MNIIKKLKGKQDNKEDLIGKYINLLVESKNDDEIFSTVEGILKYHKDFPLDAKIVETKGMLRAIYQFYVDDRKLCQEYLERATIWQLKDLEERIEADNMVLVDLSKLIIDDKNARIRKEKMAVIVSKLSPEEIELIKKQYSISLSDSDLKR